MKIKNKLMLTLTAFFAFGTSAMAEDYYICTGSFRIKENALLLQDELKQNGIDTFIYEYIKNDGLTLYRVLIDEKTTSITESHRLLDKYEDTPALRQMGITGLWCCTAEKTDAKDESPLVLEVKEQDMAPLIDVASTKEVEDSLEEEAQKEEYEEEASDICDYVEVNDAAEENETISEEAAEESPAVISEDAEETIEETAEDSSIIHDEYTLDSSIYAKDEDQGLNANELEVLDEEENAVETEEEFSLTYPEEGWSD